MNSHVETRLAEKNITLPEAAAPAANYVSYVTDGHHITISGQIPIQNGEIGGKGRLGENIDVAEGQKIAEICAINVLAQAKAAAGGNLDQVRCVKIGVFVNSTPDFTDQPAVANGASDLIAFALAEKGNHARSAVGVASLPFGVAVEVDASFVIEK